MGLFSSTVGSSRRWCRPTHRTTCCLFVTGANACCICIPSSATCFVIEMWGQGGGGAGMCCCMWGCVGGQGGDYGWKVFSKGTGAQTLCVCVCQCCCLNCNNVGHNGQFSRVTNCTCNYSLCVGGGCAGCSSCFFFVPTQSGGDYNSFERNKSHSNCAINCNCAPLSSYTISTWCCDPCYLRSIFQGLGPFLCGCCNCFDFYVRGACGWTDPTLMYTVMGTPFALCGAGAGRGGSAYAGGAGQICDCSFGNPQYQGVVGNFPGGGGSSAGGCAGGCCVGSVGGDGLVLISWS